MLVRVGLLVLFPSPKLISLLLTEACIVFIKVFLAFEVTIEVLTRPLLLLGEGIVRVIVVEVATIAALAVSTASVALSRVEGLFPSTVISLSRFLALDSLIGKVDGLELFFRLFIVAILLVRVVLLRQLIVG